MVEDVYKHGPAVQCSIWIFKEVDCISDSYHSGGGVAITAPDRESAYAALNKHRQSISTGAGAIKPEPEYVFPLRDPQPIRVIIFPDAGCC